MNFRNVWYQCKVELFRVLFLYFYCDRICLRREKSELEFQRDVTLSRGFSGKDYDSTVYQKNLVRLGVLPNKIKRSTEYARKAYSLYAQARRMQKIIQLEQQFQPA